MCESVFSKVTCHSVITPVGERRPTPDGSVNHLEWSAAICRKLGAAPDGSGYSVTAPGFWIQQADGGVPAVGKPNPVFGKFDNVGRSPFRQRVFASAGSLQASDFTSVRLGVVNAAIGGYVEALRKAHRRRSGNFCDGGSVRGIGSKRCAQ